MSKDISLSINASRKLNNFGRFLNVTPRSSILDPFVHVEGGFFSRIIFKKVREKLPFYPLKIK